MLARTQLLRVQKELYFKLKECAKQFFGGLTPEMRRYYREYQRDFSTYSSFSIYNNFGHAEFITTLESAQVAVCGDYHTLSQAQRTVIRLTRDILPTLRNQKRKLVIALEMASPAHDPILKSYVAGKLSEKALLAGLNFDKLWGFPWENYRPIFKFAQRHQIRLVGISPPPQRKAPTLQERDRYAAKVIADMSEEDPNLLIFALMGDLHLASSHLPRQLQNEYAKRDLLRETVVIHQNNETIYWELAEMGLDNKVDIVKLRDGVYCLFNSPPWVKLQSHLKWAELLSEQEETDGQTTWSDALSEVDHDEEVKGIIQSLCDFLGIHPTGWEKRFSVHGPEDRRRIVDSLRDWGYSPGGAQLVAWYLDAFQSLFIPQANYLCLATPSLNHEARLGAIFLNAQLSGFDTIYQLPREDFYRFTLVEALGFLGSKVLNPRRKSRSIDDLYRFLAEPNRQNDAPRDGRTVARLCVAHWENERRKKRISPPALQPGAFRDQILISYKTAKILGKALGEAMYRAVVDGKIDRTQIAELFQTPFHELSPAECLSLYSKWGARLDHLGYRLAKREKRREVIHGRKPKKYRRQK